MRRSGDFSILIAVALAVLVAVGTALLLAIDGDPASDDAGFANLPGLAADAPVLGAPAVSMADARARNAAVPFIAGPLRPARPFRFQGSGSDHDRAVQCLALAAMAEAGSSDPGQRAVIQVILNRTRHPAFASTVCGVVFQGAERNTGCQFSFTCDGSLARRYGDAAWQLARQRAAEALGGRVFAGVGNATHYHTDWVFPWWSPKLDKIAQVETHLFLRWRGVWGSDRVASQVYRGGEPDPLQWLGSETTTAALAPPSAAPILPADTPAITGGAVTMRDPTGKANFVLIEPGTSAAETLALARKLCGVAATCRVLGWGEQSAIPATFPIPPAARSSLQFSYSRDPAGAEIALYDCLRFAGLAREQCIPRANGKK